MKFKYWNNKEIPSKEICVIEADNILDADKKLEVKYGFNPVKCAWIGCEIVK